MNNLSKVVWSEGMYLGPHHFQAQNRYYEDTIQFIASSLAYASYGLIGWQLDNEALRNGTVALIHARGIFPDGLAFNMPECDPLPEARNISDLVSPMRESVTVALTVRRRNPDGPNVSDSPVADGARYISEVQTMHDENNGRDEKPVKMARKNIRLMLDTEYSEDMVVLPIARVKRDGAGHFMFDSNFIPPCLQISGSERLMTLLSRLIEVLDDKNATLSQQETVGASGFSQREVAKFWLLHAVNSNLAPLRHLFFVKRGHPEEVYLSMARLGGALCTFAAESHPRNLPLYDHDHLSECFEALDSHIRIHLERVLPTNVTSIQIRRTDDYFYAGAVNDQRCLGKSRWILAVQSPVGEADLISSVPKLAKVCSQKFVARLVQRAMPGLPLLHMPVPPTALSAGVETQYFGVSKTGPCWDHILETREVGIYVPNEIPSPKIELFVILE